MRGLVRTLRALVLVGAVALCALPLVVVLHPAWLLDSATAIVGMALPRTTFDTRALALSVLAMLPGLGVGLWLLARLWRLLSECLAGRVFGLVALRAWRDFARALTVLALLQPFQRAAMSVALTLGNPPGERQLVFSFGTDDYLLLLLAGTLWVVASVMADAVRMADEHRGFV